MAAAEDAGADQNSSNFKVMRKSSHLMAGLIDDVRKENKAEAEENNNRHSSPKASASRPKKLFGDLLQEEIAIRNRIRSMPGAQGKGGFCYVIGSTIINIVSAFLVFAVYLISLETLLSISLCVGLTICKFWKRLVTILCSCDIHCRSNVCSFRILTFFTYL